MKASKKSFTHTMTDAHLAQIVPSSSASNTRYYVAALKATYSTTPRLKEAPPSTPNSTHLLKAAVRIFRGARGGHHLFVTIHNISSKALDFKTHLTLRARTMRT